MIENLVSIVIPAYNAEKHIANTINSVYSQTYTSIELILVNDSSTDNTLSIVNSISAPTNIAVTVFSNEKNSGVSYSRNIGLKAAKGEYVVFLDADDVLSANFIEKRVGALAKSNIDSVCSYAVLIDVDGKSVGDQKVPGVSNNVSKEILIYNKDLSTCPSNYMFKVPSLLSNNLFFNTQLSSSADKFFLLECARKLTFGYIEDAPFYYRVHSDSMSHFLSEKILNDNEKYLDMVLVSKLVPDTVRKIFLEKANYILFAGFSKLKKFDKALMYFMKLHSISPFYLLKIVYKKCVE